MTRAIPTIAIQCQQCANFDGFTDQAIVIPKCRAFPTGIPAPISENRFDHRKPFPGDQGIRFEAKEGITPRFFF